ncbi:MAG: hypothetical protein HOJ35_09780, partial [Bdellovibrionales bacterium]|nr:hypothetical protein [Bdellovibrionales bacterium]
MKRDLPKQRLYDSVKILIDEQEKEGHLQLSQQKLFTLYSIAFQYLLFSSTKDPGAYIIRIEDSSLAEKLAKKSKDKSSRNFLQSLLLPRKLKFQKSVFYLDFFHLGTWNLTNEIPQNKIKAALIVKNSSPKLMDEYSIMAENSNDEDQALNQLQSDYPIIYYYNNILDNKKISCVLWPNKSSNGVIKSNKGEFIYQSG